MKRDIDAMGKGGKYMDPVATDTAPYWAARQRQRRQQAAIRNAARRASRRIIRQQLNKDVRNDRFEDE